MFLKVVLLVSVITIMDILILNTFVHVNRRFVRAAQVLDKVHFLLFCSSYLFYVLVDFFSFCRAQLCILSS